jgi:hypothetical protein
MSKIKISELGAATGNGLNKFSVVPIVDADDDTTKKLTVEGVKSALAYNNTVGGSGSYVTTGSENTVSGDNSLVGGGTNNEISSDKSFIGAGEQNNASGYASFIGAGNTNQASANYTSVLNGTFCTASQPYAIASGFYGRANLRGQRSHSAGRFTREGDAQYVDFVLRNRTTNATPTELFLDGSSERIAFGPDNAYFLTVEVAGFSETGADAAHYIRKVAISNVSGTTALIGSVSTIGTDVETQAGYDVAITADDIDDGLVITVTGAAATNIRWVAFVSGVQLRMP